MRILLAILISGLTPVAQAQIYQCTEGGKVSFTDTPCAATGVVSKTIAAPPGRAGRLPWDGLAQGLSVDEVRKRMPEAQALQGSQLSNGARALLGRSATIAGLSLEARYYFLDGKLVQVNANAPESSDNDETREQFERLLSAFRSFYGEPQSSDIRHPPSGLTGRVAWAQGAWISIMPVSADTSTLLSGYRPSP